MLKMKFDSFSLSMYHPRTILWQLRWSKNIYEERDAPDQIIIGSLDPRVCALLNLVVCVELTGNEALEFAFGHPQDGHRVIHRFCKIFFKKTLITSLRKGAATYAKRTGVSKDYVNLRGRTRKSVVDVYIDNTQPFPDSVAAGALTEPFGPCCHTLKDGIRAVFR
ncbi:LOW QUALITY PROTEIN: hypothetical protein PHMEG_00031835 [Phytophthora megakarya]|uniref:Uncharacterized protein n=1 Tax=Phytophthora megakarya TaxID=4795 RepID=A0A225UZN5_9STRA|nr:LOW QUALITY PROTEIN: hypothetical protein PHMEG_00031835 [Phytophthora megakarya]